MTHGEMTIAGDEFNRDPMYYCAKCSSSHTTRYAPCDGLRGGWNPRSIDDATPAEWDAASRAAMEQKAPTKDNPHPAVWPLVMRDMIDRDQSGREKYGVPLKAHNGRDTLLDAYQEALDLAVYLRTALYERDGR